MTVVVLQVFVLNETIGDVFDGETVSSTDAFFADLHVAGGIAVFIAALARLYLRFTRGVPPLPGDEPPAMRFAAHATHFALYAIILLMLVTGALAWWLSIELMAEIHQFGETAIFAVVGLHIAGAFYQRFVARTNVLRRILRPE